VPWDDCGNFVRFSVTFAAKGEEAEKTIAAEIGQRLAKYTFAF
jgi:LL-diaminopimelate aminotransferase